MLSYFHSMVTTTQLQDDALDLTVRINKKTQTTRFYFPHGLTIDMDFIEEEILLLPIESAEATYQ